MTVPLLERTTVSTPKVSIPKPWYREPWPWLLMSGPAIVVIAGIGTAIIAVRTHDGLVVDDYYKQGLTVNKDLSRDFVAKKAGYRAEGLIDAQQRRVVVEMPRAPADAKVLTLSLSRATVSGYDRQVLLQRASQNTFVGALTPLESGKWYVTLDDALHTWRLATSVVIHGASPAKFVLGSDALTSVDE